MSAADNDKQNYRKKECHKIRELPRLCSCLLSSDQVLTGELAITAAESTEPMPNNTARQIIIQYDCSTEYPKSI